MSNLPVTLPGEKPQRHVVAQTKPWLFVLGLAAGLCLSMCLVAGFVLISSRGLDILETHSSQRSPSAWSTKGSPIIHKGGHRGVHLMRQKAVPLKEYLAQAEGFRFTGRNCGQSLKEVIMAVLCLAIGAYIVRMVPAFRFFSGGKGLTTAAAQGDACMCCEMLSSATELLDCKNEDQASSGESSQSFGVYSMQCPITREVMKDPVVCSDGHTYERSAIQRWLQRNSTSPRTNLPLASNALIPNHSLRSIIHEYTIRTLIRQEAKEHRR